MAVSIEYKASVAKDLKGLDPQQRRRVLAKVERVLREGAVQAEALTGQFSGLYRIRAGDYRAIFARTGTGYLVLRIAHRREVYR